MILVHADCDAGTATRYETGGEKVRATHRYVHPNPVSYFDWAWLQAFRLDPPDDCSLTPPPRPTNSPASAGQIFREAA